MSDTAKYDFQKEWESLQKEMAGIRSCLSEISSDPSDFPESFDLLASLNRKTEETESRLGMIES